jgi:hypothetical protein
MSGIRLSPNRVLTLGKCFENAFPNVRSAIQNLRLGSIKLLQKITTSRKPTHRITCCYYLLYHLAKLLQKIVASQKNQHIASHVATLFCNHLAKLLQKIEASQKNQHIASHVATLFCNHLAKLLQKIVASQKNQHIASHVATLF